MHVLASTSHHWMTGPHDPYCTHFAFLCAAFTPALSRRLPSPLPERPLPGHLVRLVVCWDSCCHAEPAFGYRSVTDVRALQQ